jgi:energy-converting hydrogenase Eha subunit A
VLVDRHRPARQGLPKLANRRVFGQATIRHAVFGVVLGLLEVALNARSAKLT